MSLKTSCSIKPTGSVKCGPSFSPTRVVEVLEKYKYSGGMITGTDPKIIPGEFGKPLKHLKD